MLVCEVALGECFETTEHHTDYLHPPQGFNSVHGVKESGSDFKV